MSTLTLPTPEAAGLERPVHIAVLVFQDDKAEAINVEGPVRNAVRSAFAHPALAAPLRALGMDADRMIGRIVARWESSEEQQLWTKSDGSTTVRWWVDRTDAA